MSNCFMNITQSVIELLIPAEEDFDKSSNKIVIRNLSEKSSRFIFVKISARLKTIETYTAREIKLY